MVGLVIVSHSRKIAEGVKELAGQMTVEPVPMAISAGTKDGRLGTNVDEICAAINQVYSDEGVIILFDLGSALMGAEMAVESLAERLGKNQNIIAISGAALVEGAVTAAVEISLGKSLEEILKTLRELDFGKIS